MNKKKAGKILAGILIFALAGMMLMGCQKKEETPKEKKEVLKTIGNTKDKEKIELENRTGKEITQVSLCVVGEETREEVLSMEGKFADKEKRILYLPQPKETEKEGKLLSEQYDLKVVCSDGTEASLHSFPVGDVKDADIKWEEDTMFLEYTSQTTKKTVSTKDAEKAIKELEKQAQEAPAEEENKPEEEAAPAEAAPEAAPVYTEPQPQAQPQYQPQPQPQANPVESGANTTPNNPPGNSEGCINDGLFN